MNSYPKMEYKPIEHCEPGELVRLRLSTGSNWAFIATNHEDDEISVILPTAADELPYYLLLPNYTQYVLSYGKHWNILIDQDSANISLETDYKGMLILDGDRHLLIMHSPNKFLGRIFYVDLTSWKMVDPPEHGFKILKWSLEVGIGGDRFQTLVSFPLKLEKQ